MSLVQREEEKEGVKKEFLEFEVRGNLWRR
jgi:hypothetical protein